MCRYVYLYFSQCQHQKTTLLECCNAADIRTFTLDDAVTGKPQQAQVGFEQQHLRSASSLLSSHALIPIKPLVSSPFISKRCRHMSDLRDAEDEIGNPEILSNFQSSAISNCSSADCRRQPSDYPAYPRTPLLSGLANTGMKCNGVHHPSADGYLSIHSGYLKDTGKRGYIHDNIAKVEGHSSEIAPYSSLGSRSWIESLSGSPVLQLRGGGPDDVDSLQLFSPVSTVGMVTGGSNVKLSWADQVEHEIAARFEAPLSELLPGLGEANPLGELDLDVSERQESWRSSWRTASEARTRENWRNEPAALGKSSRHAVPSPSLVDSSNKTRPRSHKHRIKAMSGLSSQIQPEVWLEDSKNAAPNFEAQSQMVQMSSARVPDPDFLVQRKKDTLSEMTNAGQVRRTATSTSWLQRDQPLSWSKGFPPQEQPTNENNGQLSPESLEKRVDRSQHTIPKIASRAMFPCVVTREAQEQVPPHRFNLPSTTTAPGSTGMTWAQRVNAGGFRSTVSQKPEDPVWRQDQPQNSFASRPSLSKVGCAKESPNTVSLALDSLSSTILSPTADTSSQSAMVSEFAGVSTTDGSTAPSSTSSHLGQRHRLPLEWSATYEQRRFAMVSVSPVQNGESAPSETARLDSARENSDKDPNNHSHSSLRKIPNEIDANGSNGDDWQIVGRKSRASQPAIPSKAKRPTQRTVKSSKRPLTRPAPVNLSPVQVSPPALSTPKAWPNLQTHPSSTPPPHPLPTLKKPSYAAVAGLRSPLISFSSSTSSSADAPFISAPQTPEQPAATPGAQLVSPDCSDAYFSAAEDVELLCDSPGINHTPLEDSDFGGSPATMVSATMPSDDSLTQKQVSRETSILDLCNEQGIPGQEVSVKTLKSKCGGTLASPTQKARFAIKGYRSSVESPPNSASAFQKERCALSKRKPKLSDGMNFDLHPGEVVTGHGLEDFCRDSRNLQVQKDFGNLNRSISEVDHASTRYEALEEATLAAADRYEDEYKPTAFAENRPEDVSRLPARSRKSSPRRAHLSPEKCNLTSVKGSSSETASKASLPKTPTRNRGRRKNKCTTKLDVSSESTAPLEPQKAKEGCKDLQLLASQEFFMINTITSPARVLGSSNPQPLRSGSISPQGSPTRLPFQSPKRGRAADKVSYGSATGKDVRREASTLRGEAPEFTPQTTPSKPKPSPLCLESPVRSRPRLPDEWTQSCIAEAVKVAEDELIQSTASVSFPDAKPSESTLTPWMSKGYWMLKNGKYVGLETGCCRIEDSKQINPNDQMVTVWNTLERFGQIRRMKPCGTIKVEQAMEQIGRWCSECDPDH